MKMKLTGTANLKLSNMPTNCLIVFSTESTVHVNHRLIFHPSNIALERCDLHELIKPFPLIFFSVEIVESKLDPLRSAKPIYPACLDVLLFNKVGK